MNKARVIMVTGGQRSGKSVFSERLALSLAENPVYIATAEVMDEDFRHRVEVHKTRRGSRWTNIEETGPLSSHVGSLHGKVVLVDCVTLWATNFFFRYGEDIKSALDNLIEDFNALVDCDATFIFVTNEIGLGGVSENALQRHFADLQGSINQHIASRADEVHLIVSGLDIKIKG